MNCPHCNLTMIDQPGMAGKLMSCPQCKNTFTVPFVAVKANTTMTDLRNLAATLIMMIGGAIVGFHIFLFDPSVATEGGGRVNNLGLMHNQLIGVITGIGLAIFGAIVRTRC